MQTLANAGALSLKLPCDARGGGGAATSARSARLRQASARGAAAVAGAAVAGAAAQPASARAPSRALSIVARNDPGTPAFVEKIIQQHGKTDVSDEWKAFDDAKIDTMRGILAALEEETQAMQILKRESADRQVSEELEAMRASVKQRLRACREQELLFEQKQNDLRKRVMDNEKSLRLMETNIEKGKRKVTDATAECKRLDVEIQTVLAEIEEAEEEQRHEEREITRASEHKAFLEGMVQQCEQDFEGDIKVLMNRYYTLDAEKRTLHQRNMQLTSKLNQVRETYLKIQADVQTEQMLSNSKLHQAQVELERYLTESTDLETRANRVQEERELKKSEVGIILMAIEQIFTRIVQSCRLKPRKDAMLAEVGEKRFVPVRSDRESERLEAMVNQIIARVRDLREISEKVRAAMEQERRPTAANPVDEGDISDRVHFVQHRGHVQASSSPHSSEGNLGGGASSRQVGKSSGPLAGGADGNSGPIFTSQASDESQKRQGARTTAKQKPQ